MDHTRVGNLIDLIAEISLGSAILVIHAQLAGRIGRLTQRQRQAATGAVFGLAGILALLVPVNIGPGLTISTVTACAGLAGLFGGWIGAVIGVALPVAGRLAIDHPQLVIGAARDGAAALAGMALAAWVRRSGRPLGMRHLLVQSTLVFIVANLGNLASLSEGMAVLQAAVIPLAILLPLSTVLLGMQFLTAQHRDESMQKVAESEARLRDIVVNLPGAVLQVRQEHDASLRHLFVSDGSTATLGVTQEHLLASPNAVNDLLLPEDEEDRQRFLQEMAASMRPNMREYRIRRPDGGMDWMRTRATPSGDAEGRMLWTTFIVNISAEKRKDEELRRFTAELGESERRFRNIVASIPGIVYQARQHPDGSYRYAFISEAVREWGVSPAQALTDPALVERAWLPEEQSARPFDLPTDGTHPHVYERDYRVHLADGRVRWMHSRSVPHPARNGDIVWDGITLDITDRKNLEEELRRGERLLVLGSLTDGVAQAFNNLLRGVRGNAGRLRELLPDQPEPGAEIEQIAAAVERGAEMEQGLRSFSRRQAAQAGLLDLRTLLVELRDLSSTFAGKDIRFTLRADAGLWPAAVDARRIESAILSLILNARDAVPPGGEIAVSARNGLLGEDEAASINRSPGPYVRIVVADSGAGMSEEVLRRAMEPLFTTKSPDNASGMGLRAVNAFVNRAGGHLSLHSTPGKGTEARLLLPARPESPTAA